MQQTRLDKLLAFFNDEPGDEFLKYALATEYLRLNDTAKALEFYEDLVNNHPAYVGTYYHLGKLYEALGRKTDAVFTYQKGMEVAQRANDQHAYAELLGVYRELTGWVDEYEDD